ncbi:MAG: M17 family peptidase N-terminal domain-containing protein, partial [Actinomycetes bacterium]
MKQKPELSFKANLSWTGIDAVALGVNTGNQIIKSQVLIGLQQLLNFDYTNSFTQWPDFSGKAGEILEVPVSHPKFPISRIYLVGVGEGASSDLRKAGAALGRKVKSSGKVVLDACLAVRKSPTSREREAAVAHSVALVSSSYLWNLKTASTGVPAKFIIFGNLEAEVGYARTLSTAVWRARDLIHTPSNIKNPAWMAVQAKSMITRSKSSDLKIEVISGAALKEFGGLYAIGNSSPKPGPRFIKVSYAPKGSRNWPHVVLVGKGITYDTGGISLKRPYDVMQPMKSDMSGAAAVLST